MYIQEGAVKLSVQSQGGKEAVVAVLGLCPRQSLVYAWGKARRMLTIT
jgi:hypothetical protein